MLELMSDKININNEFLKISDFTWILFLLILQLQNITENTGDSQFLV